jgi:hypothetical protein
MSKMLEIDVSGLGPVGPGRQVHPYYVMLMNRKAAERNARGAVQAAVLLATASSLTVGGRDSDASNFGGGRAYIGGDRVGGYDMGEDDDMGGDDVDALLGGYEMGGKKKGMRQGPGYKFDQILAFDDVDVTASSTGTSKTFPQRSFIPERLTIVSSIAQNWKVNDVKVGQDTQFVSTGTVYGETFSEVATYTRLKGTKAKVGNYIAVEITNRDAVNTHTFNCSIVGKTEEN